MAFENRNSACGHGESKKSGLRACGTFGNFFIKLVGRWNPTPVDHELLPLPFPFAPFAPDRGRD